MCWFVREFTELVNRDRRQFETFRPRVVTTLDRVLGSDVAEDGPRLLL
jgi:hypothetical protein